MSAKLKAAIEANDLAAVREAIKSVKDINAKLFDGKSPVVLACELGADQALDALLEAKAKVAGKRSEHPFCIAVQNERHKVMDLLFQKKKVSADTMHDALGNALREEHEATLQFMLRQFKPPIDTATIITAGHTKNPNMIRALAAADADMNVVREIEAKDTTALHQLVNMGPAILRALVECGANVNVHDGWGRTPLMILADEAPFLDQQVEGHHRYQERLKQRALEHPERAEALLKMRSDDVPPSGEQTIQTLLELGADSTLKDHEGNDALDYYRSQCRKSKNTPENPKIIELLRKAGAKGDETSFNLFSAIYAEDLAALRKAIAAGADVNRISPTPGYYYTPLSLAAWRERTDFIDPLLKAGADPNKADRTDRPILRAIQQGYLPIVQRLIEAGADVSLRHPKDIGEDCPAMNAFETAEWAGRKNVIKYLKSIGADRSTEYKPPEPGIQSWNDFSEILIKADLPTVAKALANITGGKIQPNAYGESIKLGKHAFVVAHPLGMAWCNVFQLAPSVDWLDDVKAAEAFASELAKAADAPTLFIGYSDTSDAAGIARFEPNAKPKRKNGQESDNDWLINLAKKEKFVAAAFRPVPEGNIVDLTFPGYPAEAFDGVAFIGK